MRDLTVKCAKLNDEYEREKANGIVYKERLETIRKEYQELLQKQDEVQKRPSFSISGEAGAMIENYDPVGDHKLKRMDTMDA